MNKPQTIPNDQTPKWTGKMIIKGDISVGTIISVALPILTFGWYRSGRLWNLFFCLRLKSLKQFKHHSIDRVAWNQLFQDEINELSQTIFGAVFSFENAYLRSFLISRWENTLWLSKASTSGHTTKLKNGKFLQVVEEFEITDDDKYIQFEFRNALGYKFLFAGMGLFLCSSVWAIKNLFHNSGRKRKITKTILERSDFTNCDPFDENITTRFG